MRSLTLSRRSRQPMNTKHLALLYDYESKVIRVAEGCTNSQAAMADVIGARKVLLDREADLRTAFTTFLAQVKTMAQQLPINTGTCCCGSPMADHDPFDNHSPRDEGEYFVTRAIEAAEEALGQ